MQSYARADPGAPRAWAGVEGRLGQSASISPVLALCVSLQGRVVEAADKHGSQFCHVLEVGLGTFECCEVVNFWVSVSHGARASSQGRTTLTGGWECCLHRKGLPTLGCNSLTCITATHRSKLFPVPGEPSILYYFIHLRLCRAKILNEGS